MKPSENIRANSINIDGSCQIHPTASIHASGEVRIGKNSRIGPGVHFTGGNLVLGIGCHIDEGARFFNTESVSLGDHSYIGPLVRIIEGRFSTGDYSKIHYQTYVCPRDHVTLGHLAWIGQGSTLDGTGGLTAGNFLGVGINSALYSHIRHGDVLEGCRFDKNTPLVIGDDVWFVGMCMVSPAKIGSRSMALLGSVVVRDMQENCIYGGNPAVDLTSKLGNPWKTVSLEEKRSVFLKYLDTYRESIDPTFEKDAVSVVDDFPDVVDDRIYYNLRTREYTKKNGIEVPLNKWLFPYRAKFTPR